MPLTEQSDEIVLVLLFRYGIFRRERDTFYDIAKLSITRKENPQDKFSEFLSNVSITGVGCKRPGDRERTPLIQTGWTGLHEKKKKKIFENICRVVFILGRTNFFTCQVVVCSLNKHFSFSCGTDTDYIYRDANGLLLPPRTILRRLKQVSPNCLLKKYRQDHVYVWKT